MREPSATASDGFERDTLISDKTIRLHNSINVNLPPQLISFLQLLHDNVPHPDLRSYVGEILQQKDWGGGIDRGGSFIYLESFCLLHQNIC